MKNKRKSNIELLRIILIIMIIVLHYFNEKLGGYFSYVHAGSISFYFAHILESLSIVAVNVFVLITGYFSVNKHSINISKVLRLVLIMIFWGLVLSTITVFFLDPQNINLSLIFKIFKSATNQWLRL